MSASTENKLKFMWDCANVLSTETHTKKLLKSYYLQNCRKITQQHKLVVPKEKFSNAHMCPRCSCFWSENDFKLKLLPQEVAKTTKAKRLVAQFEESSRTGNSALLTRKQRQRAKWLKKRLNSKLEIHCKFCQHKTLLPLEKPNKRAKQSVAVQINEGDAELAKPKKRKRKSKDKNAGLKIAKKNIPAMNKRDQVSTEQPKQPTPLKKESTATKINAQHLPKKKPTKDPIRFKPKLPILQSKIAQKNKKKKKGGAQTPAPLIAQKVQSKTQKQNALLQLAAQLKAQAAKPAQNTTQQRLAALLE